MSTTNCTPSSRRILALIVAVFVLRALLVLRLVVAPVIAVRFGRPGAWRAAGPAVGVVVGGLTLVGLAGVVWFGEEVPLRRPPRCGG